MLLPVMRGGEILARITAVPPAAKYVRSRIARGQLLLPERLYLVTHTAHKEGGHTSHVFSAGYRGSMPDAYQVKLVVREGKVVESSCTCPDQGAKDANGITWCKHRVLLLIQAILRFARPRKAWSN